MKKTIKLNLKLNHIFFVELKEKILHMNGFDKFDEYIQSVISPIMNATLLTLTELSATQNQKTNKSIKFSYEYKENIYPKFHHLLDNNIDKALNKKIHTTTLERITDIIEDFMNEYADKQKEKNTISLFDQEKEIQAIKNYISTTWDGADKFDSDAFFNKVWDMSNELLKNKYDQYGFSELYDSLKEVQELPNILINGHMNSSELLMNFIISSSKLSDSLKKSNDFEKSVNSILSKTKSEFPEAKNMKPKDWIKFGKNYRDYQGMDELDTDSLKKLFNGIHSGTAGTSSFEVRTSLPHVMYDDKCQGRKPLEVLVGSIFCHSYVMNEKNNATKMINEWKLLVEKLEEQPVKELQFEFQEPLNKALLEIIKNDLKLDPKALAHLEIINKSNNKLKP